MLLLDMFMCGGYDLVEHQNLDLSILKKIEFGKIIWNLIRSQQFAICWGVIGLAVKIQ